MKSIPIPQHWSADQALTTVAFLESVISAVWEAYGTQMVNGQQHMRLLLEAQRPCCVCINGLDPPPQPDTDDEIPF